MQLLQFKGDTALLVVMGSQRGLLYLASNGQIDIIGTVEQPEPRYSDREGHFMHTGRGMQFGSGSVYEENNIERVRRFFKTAAEEIHRIVRMYGVTHTYVFEPHYAKGAVTETLLPLEGGSVELVRFGNYLHAPATRLIEFIQQAHEPVYDPADPETVSREAEGAEEKRKILTHAMQARSVVGGRAY